MKMDDPQCNRNVMRAEMSVHYCNKTRSSN